MKTTNKKELSYFRLKLESYLSEHFPEKVEDKPLSRHELMKLLLPIVML